MTTKEQRIERVEIKKIYVAKDGTEFENEGECLKYEQTARCAINGMFEKLNAQRTDGLGENEPFNLFYCEDTMYAVKIENENQLEVVNKWIKQEEYSAKCLGVEAIGTIQLINRYDGGVWVAGTPDDLKKRYIDGVDALFNKLIEKSEESKQETA